MKALLVYKLPEEAEEYQLAMDGAKYKIVIEELDSWLRNMYKYEDKFVIEIAEVRAQLASLLNDRGI